VGKTRVEYHGQKAAPVSYGKYRFAQDPVNKRQWVDDKDLPWLLAYNELRIFREVEVEIPELTPVTLGALRLAHPDIPPTVREALNGL